MAVYGQVDPRFKELNDARDSLLRELERIAGETAAPHLLNRMDRYIEAKIRTSVGQQY